MKATKRICTQVAFTLLGSLATLPVAAQEKTEVNVGADLVSSYIWRGTDCGGVSIQPTLSVARSGFSLTAWGSVGFEGTDTKELDFTLGYNTGGLTVAVTDYWFDRTDGVPSDYFDYRARSTAHVFEATLAYDFGLLALSWNTHFAGSDYTKANGDRAYSTYIEARAPFKLGGTGFVAEVGFTPWEGAYSDKFNVTNIGLRADRSIRITDNFALPVFAKVTMNPYEDKAYFVFGMAF